MNKEIKNIAIPVLIGIIVYALVKRIIKGITK